jgi:hypothetical protein
MVVAGADRLLSGCAARDAEARYYLDMRRVAYPGATPYRAPGTDNWSRGTDFQSRRPRFRSCQTDSWTTPGRFQTPTRKGMRRGLSASPPR